jgi:hypothetical protein
MLAESRLSRIAIVRHAALRQVPALVGLDPDTSGRRDSQCSDE